ncbi:PAS domain-containing protein [Aerophototrophica crusticola]|uniref:histidine kinase n=1 Tax=Aerophototrophica crusticola TaxID=1709002 RepID=A0A858R9W5_9PROT|nr:PAS domain-containing protein [Rhodospirillaceae bacterium B3]
MQVLPETSTGFPQDDPYRAAFELSGVGMVLVDPVTWRIALANDAIAGLIGYRAGDILGRSGYDVVHPDDREASRTGLDALVRGDVGPYAVERRFLHRDGHVVWLRLHISLSRDAQGRPRHVIMAGEDVSERRAVEQALREGEARLRLLTDAMPALIARIGPDLRYQFVNAAYRDWFGLEPDHVLGRSMPKVLGREAYEVIAPRVAAALAGERVSFEAEMPYPCGPRVVRADYLPSRGPDGRVNGIYTLAFDITPLARSRQEVVAIYRGYFDNTAESLFSFAITPDGGFAFEELNPAHQRSTGLRIAEIRGKRLEEVLPGPIAAEVSANYRRCLEAGHPISYEETLELPAGKRCWDTVLVPVREGDGPFTRIIGSSRDITERRQAEAALARETAERQQAETALRQSQKMEALGRLTGGVAHDFNNLLTIIQGNLEVATRRLGPEQGELAEEIEAAAAAAQRAAALTQRLLAFSRRQALAPAATDLNALLAGTEDLLRQALGEGIKVERRPAPDLWLTWCDAHQMESAILNLGINARDAMPDGGRLMLETANVTLAPGECGSCPDARPGDYVRLSVADNGCGMGRDVLEQAFDPFFTTKPWARARGWACPRSMASPSSPAALPRSRARRAGVPSCPSSCRGTPAPWPASRRRRTPCPRSSPAGPASWWWRTRRWSACWW